MSYTRPQFETKRKERKYIRYKDGAERYSIGVTKFMQLAKEARAVYKIDGVVLVNTEIFERFLESFRLD